MGLLDEISRLNKAMKQMNRDLSERPDDKLIEGYNKAMTYYRNTNGNQYLIAANMIKKELDKRGIKVE